MDQLTEQLMEQHHASNLPALRVPHRHVYHHAV